MTVRLTLVLIAAAATAPASAGMIAPCQEPGIFRGASVNLVVLPYTVDESSGAGPKAGEDLSALLYVQGLAAILPYGTVGAVRLVDTGVGCDPPTLLSAVKGQLAPGGGAILLSGRVYRDGEALFVASSVHWIRGAPALSTVTVGGQSFSSDLASSALSFPPRRVTAQDLTQLHADADSALRLHAEPSDASPSRSFSKGSGDPHFRFTVIGEAPGFMRLRVEPSGATGWVRAEHRFGASPLDGTFPEIHFVKGAAGLLSMLARGGAPPSAKAALEGALRRYSEIDAGTPPSLVALQMLGISRLQGSEAAAAEEQLLEVARRLPGDPAAGNLALIAAVARRYQPSSGVENDRDLARRWLDLVAADPASDFLLANLRSFYRLVRPTAPTSPRSVDDGSGPDQTPLTSVEIDTALQRIAAVKLRR